jgi:DNA-binding transcriptional LysR family regulator
MNIANLQAFIAVADTGSIRRAAARLHITQPAVTRRVQNLEASVGVALLDRSSKPPTLTVEGRQVLRLGRQILQAVSDLLSSAKPSAQMKGELRLGTSLGLDDDALSQALDALARQYAGLAIRVTPGWSLDLIEAMRSGDLDAAIVLVTEPHELDGNLPFRPLAEEQAVVIASKATNIARRASFAELASCGWVLNRCAARVWLEKAFNRAQLPFNVRAEVQGYDLQMALVARGLGLGLVPRGRFRASPQQRRLVEIQVDGFDLRYTAALTWRSSAGRLLPALTVLENALRQNADQPIGEILATGAREVGARTALS